MKRSRKSSEQPQAPSRATEPADVLKLVREISSRLDTIEDLTAFLVRANQRFRKGQRVKFSPAAERKGITRRIKGGAKFGTVTKVDDGFTVGVLLDGYTRPHNYHHSFFVKK